MLGSLHIPYADVLLNGVMITAAFSTMVAAMFAVTRVLLSLGEDGEAPRFLLKRNRRGIPVRALLAGSMGLTVAILVSFVLPREVYELLTTSAGIILILKWLIILWTHYRFRRQTESEEGYRMWGYPLRNGLVAAVIFLVLSGSLLDRNHTVSLLVSMGLVGIIAGVYGIYRVRITGAGRLNPQE